MQRCLKTVALLAVLTAIACGSPVDNATSTLIEQVRLGDPLAQSTYAENKELLESAEAVPIWISVLQTDESASVQQWAAQILGTVGDEAALPALVSAMSAQRDVRDAAVDAIRQFPDEVAARAFSDALQSDNRDARVTALGQLGRLGDASATAAVVESIHSGEPLVAQTAINTLGDLGGADAAAALGDLVLNADMESDMRSAALSNLGRLDPAVAGGQIERVIAALEEQEDASGLLDAARSMQ